MREIVILCQYFVVGKAFSLLTHKKSFSNGQQINVPLIPIITLKVNRHVHLFPKTHARTSLICFSRVSV